MSKSEEMTDRRILVALDASPFHLVLKRRRFTRPEQAGLEQGFIEGRVGWRVRHAVAPVGK